MASKFKVWVDSPIPGTNVQTYEDFKDDAQRASGFAMGVVASSIRANSILRQSSLVTAALMGAILPSSTLDFTSDLDDLIDEMKEYFEGIEGAGLPPGGSKGDLLRKKSNTSFDTEWFDGTMQLLSLSLPTSWTLDAAGYHTVSVEATGDYNSTDYELYVQPAPGEVVSQEAYKTFTSYGIYLKDAVYDSTTDKTTFNFRAYGDKPEAAVGISLYVR